jgi:hypothetical protein
VSHWAATRQGSSLFPVVGLPRNLIHKELPNLAKGYEYVVIDGGSVDATDEGGVIMVLGCGRDTGSNWSSNMADANAPR